MPSPSTSDKDAGWRNRQRQRYDQVYSVRDFSHFGWEKAYIKFLTSKLPGRPTSPLILDVGCGTGYYTQIFQRLGFPVCGIDLSRTALSKAQARSKTLPLIQGDAISLPFKDEAFDMVFCHGLSLFNVDLSHQVQSLAADLVRCLARDGILIFAWSSNLRTGKSGRSWREHSDREIRQLLVGLGLQIEEYYFFDRRLALSLLGRYCFNRIVTAFSSRFSRVTGLPGLMLFVSRRPA